MPINLRALLAACTGAAAGAATAYLAAALVRTRAFAAASPAPGQTGTPAVSVLKPLCGLEPGLFENLCSFCVQDYPTFEILFGVADRSDPAAAIAQRVIDRFPRHDLRLVVSTPASARNPKVANLMGMIDVARYDVLVIADADMRVDAAYLRALVAPLAQARTGAVTALYGAKAAATGTSELAALFHTDTFAPSVLVALLFEPLRYCFGSTMLVRRDVLAQAGGLAALGAYVNDDYRLGKLVSDLGYEVALARYVVCNVVAEPSLRALWRHELRWARTIRAARPAGYAASVLTHALAWCMLHVAVTRRRARAAALLALASGLRVALHYAARAAFAPAEPARPWLIPARDALTSAVWCASFFGRGMQWRDRSLRIDARGAIDEAGA